ncbi:DUF4190 domain-containing protein [Aeromicrobium sp. NPDC092404]|uniref:DUF4190 domain-containing protein n=1 Tax=Aeromicrobium sp. NPDC092404 TaxID=3154976 RepID=UPI003437C19E
MSDQGPQPPRHYPYVPQPSHPQSTTALVLGIVGLSACQLVAPVAWAIGNKAVREIDASQGAYGGRSEANAGRILGIVGTCLIGAVALLFLAMLGLGFVFDADADYSIGGLL